MEMAVRIWPERSVLPTLKRDEFARYAPRDLRQADTAFRTTDDSVISAVAVTHHSVNARAPFLCVVAMQRHAVS